jgi:hypothetical protein
MSGGSGASVRSAVRAVLAGLSVLLVMAASGAIEAQASPGPGPVVTAVAPNAGQGATQWRVAVTGVNFQPRAALSFPGAGVSAARTLYISGSMLIAVIDVTADAPIGIRGATVTNADGASGTCEACFTVDPGPAPRSASPSSGARGQNLLVRIKGSGFQDRARLSFGAGVVVLRTVFKSPAELDVVIRIAPSAVAGPRNLAVLNTTDGGRGSCPACFTIAAT